MGKEYGMVETQYINGILDIQEDKIPDVRVPEVILHPVQLSRALFDVRGMLRRGEIQEAMAVLKILDDLLLSGRTI